MNIFKALFGGSKENPAEEKQEHQEKDFEILKFDGVRALKTRQAEYAIKCFRHALDIKDDNETRDYLTQALMANNELLEAMNELQILAEKVGDNAAVYLRMADVAYLMDDYASLEKACASALAIDGESTKAKYLMAVAYEGLTRRDEAIKTLTDIIENTEEAYSSRLLRGVLYLRDNKLDEALADAEKLNEENADNEDVLMLMAQIYHAMKRLDEAEELCSKVIELDPFSLSAFSERASVRSDKGDKEGEKSDLQTVMELNPNEGTQDDDPTQTMMQKMKDSQINPLGI